MNKHIIGLLTLASASLLVIPGINFFWSEKGQPLDWSDPAALYNVDFGRRLVSNLLVPLGISTDSSNVIVGKDGWFFLGDAYANAVSEQRRAPSQADGKRGKTIGKFAGEWQYYLCQSGVKAYKIIVGPNKSSIYPENAPFWMQAPSPSVTDTFMQELGPQYVDVRASLLEAKKVDGVPLYFATDSHWNTLGAGLAFRHFAEQMAKDLPDVRWPSEETYVPRGRQPRRGGDLAAFLSLEEDYLDQIELLSPATRSLRTKQIDWRSGKTMVSGPNQPVPRWGTPILVQSPDALNKRRVLWLRDSFGTNMAPFMSQTFSDVLQLHWSEGMKPEVLRELVEGFHPDYVFVTVVERDARSEAFSKPLPLPGMSGHALAGDEPVLGVFQTSHDVVPAKADTRFAITGPDPSLFFSVPKDLDQAGKTHLKIDLRCEDPTQPVQLQVFWATHANPVFDEERSVRLTYEPKKPFFPLSILGAAGGRDQMTRLRIDVDSPHSCSTFNLSPPAFVKLAPAGLACN